MKVNLLRWLLFLPLPWLFADPSCCLAGPRWMPKVGDKAPLVEGQDQDGHTWRLADFVGKKIVLLYFYPKDFTPHCEKEACGFRDSLDDLKKENVEVAGVSFDSQQSHQKFAAANKLTFPLLADTKGKIADAYGARITNMRMAGRISFLIGLDGKVAYVNENANADKQIVETKEAVEKLTKK
jgi:thioredoxin-dependent peroxiredoxin